MRIISLKKSSFSEALVYAFVFLATFKFPIDTDLGWHLKQGEYFALNHKILDTNILSTGMAGFHYINHSWLYDFINYLIFHFWGFIGLSVFGSFTAVLIFYFISNVIKIDLSLKLLIFPIFLLLEAGNFVFSFYSQNVSLLFAVILIYLLAKLGGKRNQLLSILALALMIIWSNLHGEFIVGLGIIFLFTFCYFIKKIIKKEGLFNPGDLPLLFLPAISLFGTLLNPYGIQIYGLVARHFLNPTLSHRILEWKTPIHIFPGELVFLTLGMTTAIFVLIYKREVLNNLFLVLVPVIFLALSFTATRYLWIALIVFIPLLCLSLKNFPKDNIWLRRFSILTILALYIHVGLVGFPYRRFIHPNWNTFCAIRSCSPEAAKFITEKRLTHNLFTSYELGGWLIWNFPEVKPFVDGRMSVWAENVNGSFYSPFNEMYDYEQGLKPIDQSRFDTIFITKSKPIYYEMEKLTQEGRWSQAFEDFHAAVYVRNRNQAK